MVCVCRLNVRSKPIVMVCVCVLEYVDYTCFQIELRIHKPFSIIRHTHLWSMLAWNSFHRSPHWTTARSRTGSIYPRSPACWRHRTSLSSSAAAAISRYCPRPRYLLRLCLWTEPEVIKIEGVYRGCIQRVYTEGVYRGWRRGCTQRVIITGTSVCCVSAEIESVI